MKIDLMVRSSPFNSDGSGKPSFLIHADGEYVWPVVACLWNNFWKTELEEKHSRTLILSVPLRMAFSDRFLRT